MNKLRYFDGIRYGEYRDLEVLVDPSDNSLWIANRSIEIMLGYSMDTARYKIVSKSFKTFSEYAQVEIITKSSATTDSKGRPNAAVFLHKDTAMAFIGWAITKESIPIPEPSPEMVHWIGVASMFFSKKIKSNKSVESEKGKQEALAARLNGEIEVVCPVGRIDILTSSEIIEVKMSTSWKSALGQVLAYRHFYPSHTPTIALYGSVHGQIKEMIEEISGSLGVKVRWI